MGNKAIGFFFLLLFINISFASYYELLGERMVPTELLKKIADEESPSEEGEKSAELDKEFTAESLDDTAFSLSNLRRLHFNYSDKLIVLHLEREEQPPRLS